MSRIVDPAALPLLLTGLVSVLAGAAVLLVFSGCVQRQQAVHDLIVESRRLQNEQLERRRRMLTLVRSDAAGPQAKRPPDLDAALRVDPAPRAVAA